MRVLLTIILLGLSFGLFFYNRDVNPISSHLSKKISQYDWEAIDPQWPSLQTFQNEIAFVNGVALYPAQLYEFLKGVDGRPKDGIKSLISLELIRQQTLKKYKHMLIDGRFREPTPNDLTWAQHTTRTLHELIASQHSTQRSTIPSSFTAQDLIDRSHSVREVLMLSLPRKSRDPAETYLLTH